jgi:hypothetical protein
VLTAFVHAAFSSGFLAAVAADLGFTPVGLFVGVAAGLGFAAVVFLPGVAAGLGLGFAAVDFFDGVAVALGLAVCVFDFGLAVCARLRRETAQSVASTAKTLITTETSKLQNHNTRIAFSHQTNLSSLL